MCIVCIVFCFPLLFTYSVGLKRSCFKPYTAADAAPWQCRVCAVLNSCDYFSEFKKFQSEMLGRKERRCVIIANLLRCYRIRAWSCTSDVRKKRRLRQDVVCLVAVSSEWTRRDYEHNKIGFYRINLSIYKPFVSNNINKIQFNRTKFDKGKSVRKFVRKIQTRRNGS